MKYGCLVRVRFETSEQAKAFCEKVKSDGVKFSTIEPTDIYDRNRSAFMPCVDIKFGPTCIGDLFLYSPSLYKENVSMTTWYRRAKKFCKEHMKRQIDLYRYQVTESGNSIQTHLLKEMLLREDPKTGRQYKA